MITSRFDAYKINSDHFKDLMDPNVDALRTMSNEALEVLREQIYQELESRKQVVMLAQ